MPQKVALVTGAAAGIGAACAKRLAQHLGQYGITVNNIPPGSVMHTIMSEANRDRMEAPDESEWSGTTMGTGPTGGCTQNSVRLGS
jgi:NAD(P)-dependent dehydrogenase (short-subunit alcohol dehydrogenase family)